VASRALGPIASNIPLPGAPRLDLDKITGALSASGRAGQGAMTGVGHAMVDFGDDELTHGRPHPMIDNSLRAEWLLAQAAQPDVGSLLLDVVLGHGAHADPAGELAKAIERSHEVASAAGHDIAVVVSLCGTQADPQGLERQAARLVSAGASVHLSNADAARTAVELLSPAE
jgi:FdrA protein